MGIGSIVLGAFAFICMVAGALLSLVPFLGTMLSFLAPVLALVGIILGGVALSRAKSGGGESEGLAIGGLVTSILAFIPSVLVALTCGLCNVCATGMYLDPSLGTVDSGVHDAGIQSNGSFAPPPFPSSAPAWPTTTVPSTPAPSTTVPSTTVPPSSAPIPSVAPSALPTTSGPPTAAPGTQGSVPPPPPLPPNPGAG